MQIKCTLIELHNNLSKKHQIKARIRAKKIAD